MQAPKLLADFLAAHSVPQVEVATLLGVDPATVSYWLSGSRKPQQQYREALERWTSGAVPADTWLDAAARRELDRLRGLPPKVAT